jgi:hypothetical protein
MNFHMFVLISTVVFYILLKIYKKSINKRNKRKSNLVYVLIVPAIMYLYHFMYIQKDVTHTNNINISVASTSNTPLPSESLLTSPFPESSVSIGSVGSSNSNS